MMLEALRLCVRHITTRTSPYNTRIASHELHWFIHTSFAINLWLQIIEWPKHFSVVWHRNGQRSNDRWKSMFMLYVQTQPHNRLPKEHQVFLKHISRGKNTIYPMHLIIFGKRCNSIVNFHRENQLICNNYLSFFGNCQSHDCNVLLKNVVKAKKNSKWARWTIYQIRFVASVRHLDVRSSSSEMSNSLNVSCFSHSTQAHAQTNISFTWQHTHDAVQLFEKIKNQKNFIDWNANQWYSNHNSFDEIFRKTSSDTIHSTVVRRRIFVGQM